MKYIIMAGRSLTNTKLPKQLWQVGCETVIGRTIRLLKKSGVKNIAISTNDDRFQQFGLKLLKHHNDGPWINAFYPTDDPTCYIFGDVVFSEEAIKTIVETETDSIQFFASSPPFAPEYPKKWAEPFAYKVVDQKYFRECINTVRKGIEDGIWKRDPIAWEWWQVIKKTPVNKINYKNYVVINDFTCDVDELKDLCYYKDMDRFDLNDTRPHYMIHTYPGRAWYVDEYLVPSMLEQGIEQDQIYVFNDEARLGNLKACMNSWLTLPEQGGTWHLQDDVLICRDFKERTEENNSGFVAGFMRGYPLYNPEIPYGLINLVDMPWTFPCIRIPNKVARDCAEWILKWIIGNPVYTANTKDGNGDDWAFKLYAQNFLKDKKMLNLLPSLVEHIDWLIGGSSVGSKRVQPTVAKCFDDQDLVKELKEKLWKRKENLSLG